MNIEEINGAIRTIADNFKNPSQQLKLIEELGELSRELSKDIAVGRNISTATISEIVDVVILIEQILYLAEEEAAELAREQLEYKLQRTLRRIEKGYYEK
jgi:NTP pyrophosphatase (non-canonical NTP hydrolase)